MIYNAYDGRLIQRVQVADDRVEALICETFITTTNDLFVVTFESTMYRVYKIDLDETNMSEFDEEDAKNMDEMEFSRQIQLKYRLKEPILEYDQNLVENKKLNQFHVRGSSHKELVDLNRLL